MVSHPFEEHISPECDGSGYILCVVSDSLDLLRVDLGVKMWYIDFDNFNFFFMYPEPSRYRTLHSTSVKPEWIKIEQIYPYFIHFGPKYSNILSNDSLLSSESKSGIGHGILILILLNYFFHVYRSVTVQNGSFRICEARVGQNWPGLPLLYTLRT